MNDKPVLTPPPPAGTRGKARRLRVAMVHYADSATAGGSLRVGELLANNLDPTQVEAHLIFAYGGPGPVASQARVPCHFVGAGSSCDLAAWGRARNLVNRLKPDIIHYQDLVMWMQMALSGIPAARVVHVHGQFDLSAVKLRDRLFWRAMAHVAAGHVCISHGTRRSLVEDGWASPKRAWTVTNAIDCKRFETLPGREEARVSLGLPQDKKLAGMVCRLTRDKACGDALHILKLLPPAWSLAFFGDGPLRGPLEQMAKAEGLIDRVHFAGLISDVRPAYAAMDIFLQLARKEAFGLAICEAMASGVPVFALAGAGDFRERENPVVTPDSAVIVERADPTAIYDAPEEPAVLSTMAQRIARFGERPGEYAEMVSKARSRVRERFDAPVQAEGVLTVYRTILARPRRGRMGAS